MAKQLGRLFLLKAKIGGAYTTVGGLKSTKLSLNNSTIDVTTLDSVNVVGGNSVINQEIEAGVQKMSVDGSMLFDSDATFKMMMDASRTQAPLDCEVIWPNYGTFQNGAFLVTKLEGNAPFDKEITASITLEASGAINFTAAA
jgi:predicted secreted protein